MKTERVIILAILVAYIIISIGLLITKLQNMI